jgi:hypothetical protein
MKNNECEDCNGNGYINTYNTKDNVQEIQRCDTCKVYEDDNDALEQFIISNDYKTCDRCCYDIVDDDGDIMEHICIDDNLY